MSITFHCENCGRTLTTSEDRSGQKAKCPGCGEVVTVPPPSAPPDVLEDTELVEDHDGEQPAEQEAPPVRKAPPTKTCPMCGMENPRKAGKCQACGEEFPDTPDEEPTRRKRGMRTNIEVGEVMSDSWETFKENFGIAVGAHIISAMLMGMAFIPFIVLAVIAFIIVDQQQGAKEPPIGLLLGMIPAFLVGMAVVVFLMPGVIRFFIGLARRDPNVELTMIFKGGRYALTYLWVSVVYGLLLTLGFVLCLIPGFIATIFLWPLVYVACDDRSEEGNYFGRTLELTRPNWVLSLLVIAVMFGMQFGLAIVGALPCIGPIISMASLLIQPFFQLIWATAYVKMSGQD